MRKVYGEAFDQVRGAIDAAQAAGGEIQAMLGGTFRQLNTDFGFSLQVQAPTLAAHIRGDHGHRAAPPAVIGLASTLRWHSQSMGRACCTP